MSIVSILKKNYFLIGILLVGAFLRFHHLNSQSPWLDEVHTLIEASPDKSLAEIYRSLCMADPHPPLYFYVVHFLFKIFGYQILAARIFSALLGIAGIYAMYKFGKELFNKEAGLIAALLTVVNSYQIYYSQEARPYSLLFVFSVCSFLYLVRFIKLPSRKNAVWYGIFTALMLYGHLSALFALLAQMVILLFFFIIIAKENRKAFFVNAAIAGLITILLFLPTIGVIQWVMKVKSFWATMPEPDVYTLMFKEFFGNSELVLGLISIALLMYLIRLSKEKRIEMNYNAVASNNVLLSFIVFSVWIVIVILIPLIRSYMSVPMIVSRYFINVLPAILLIITIGLLQFKNQLIRYSLVTILIVFSLSDLFFIRQYYYKVNKTQFREVSEFIIENNKNNDPVVTGLSWHFAYFLSNDENKYTLVGKNLEDYVIEMKQDSTKLKPFWYVDAHIRPYTLSPESEAFLNRHYFLENGTNLYDAWTKHYELVGNSPKTIDISHFKDIQTENGDPLRYTVEKYGFDGKKLDMYGWAYFPDQQSMGTQLSILLIKDGKPEVLKMKKITRADVTSYFNSSYNIDSSGFEVSEDLSALAPGKYQIAIYAKNGTTKKEALILTDKIIQK